MGPIVVGKELITHFVTFGGSGGIMNLRNSSLNPSLLPASADQSRTIYQVVSSNSLLLWPAGHEQKNRSASQCNYKVSSELL